MCCFPHQSGWVRVHRQPGQMPRWGKSSPGSDTSARGIDTSAVVASRGPRLGKASSDTRFCNANPSGKDKARWLFSHSVARSLQKYGVTRDYMGSARLSALPLKSMRQKPPFADVSKAGL